MRPGSVRRARQGQAEGVGGPCGEASQPQQRKHLQVKGEREAQDRGEGDRGRLCQARPHLDQAVDADRSEPEDQAEERVEAGELRDQQLERIEADEQRRDPGCQCARNRAGPQEDCDNQQAAGDQRGQPSDHQVVAERLQEAPDDDRIEPGPIIEAVGDGRPAVVQPAAGGEHRVELVGIGRQFRWAERTRTTTHSRNRHANQPVARWPAMPEPSRSSNAGARIWFAARIVEPFTARRSGGRLPHRSRCRCRQACSSQAPPLLCHDLGVGRRRRQQLNQMAWVVKAWLPGGKPGVSPPIAAGPGQRP